MQRYRERQLEPPGEEEDDDEEEEEEQTQEDGGDQEATVTNDQDDANKSGQSVISSRLQLYDFIQLILITVHIFNKENTVTKYTILENKITLMCSQRHKGHQKTKYYMLMKYVIHVEL
jgi:hypothetical protein